MKNLLTFLLTIGCFTVFAPFNNQAQTQSRFESSSFSSLENTDTISILRHHAGWGVSSAEGHATLGRDEGEFLFSAFYAYSLSKQIDIECAFHYLPIQRFRSWRGILSPDTSGYISLSWYSDISVMFGCLFPSVSFLNQLHFGGGLSFSSSSQMYLPNANTVSFANSNAQFVRGSYRIPTYYHRFNAGFNAKIEYILPLSQTLELTVRGQLHLLPFWIETNNIFGSSTVGSLSLGGFLRFNR